MGIKMHRSLGIRIEQLGTIIAYNMLEIVKELIMRVLR